MNITIRLVADDATIRARLRLVLRAERAFGLGSLPAPPQAPMRQNVTPPARPAPARATAPAPSVEENRPKSAAGVNLFGEAESAPATTPAVSFTEPPLPREEKIARLKLMDETEVKGCTKCRLCEQRTNTVFGEGDAEARLFFIGEGPGEKEDLQGRPFVGRAGELLNKWIAAMGLRREQVYIANIVKCRPPGNREPAPDEVATCTPYLERQLSIIRPAAIITLGRPAAQHMLQTKNSMGKMRGHWQTWRGIKLMPTYHPAYVLRNYTYETRAAVWSDLQLVMKELSLPLPQRHNA